MLILKYVSNLIIKLFPFLLCISFAIGCSTERVIVGGAVGEAGALGSTPGHQLEQVYYLGVLDPQEQTPPTVYRITVKGQASSFSLMKFGSGWVHANLVDSLNTRMSFDNKSRGSLVQFEKESKEEMAAIKTGRRMVMFGPEGFREAPADHRLVIVMRASPEEYFQAMDSVLGEISQAQNELSQSEVKDVLIQTFFDIKSEQEKLKEIKFASELENARQLVKLEEQKLAIEKENVTKDPNGK